VMMLAYIYISRPNKKYCFYFRNITSEIHAVATLYVDVAATTVTHFRYINTIVHHLINHNVLCHAGLLFFNSWSSCVGTVFELASICI
jgi:hypothetical protein